MMFNNSFIHFNFTSDLFSTSFYTSGITFENKLSEAIKENELTTQVNYETEQNVWGDLLLSLLPFALIIGIWIFIMRRMSGGGGGGAGGQIFNIVKSSLLIECK